MKINSTSTKLSDACATPIKAHLLMFGEVNSSKSLTTASTDVQSLPMRSVYFIKSMDIDQMRDDTYRFDIDMTTVRTTNKNLCTFTNYTTFISQECSALMIVYYDMPTANSIMSRLKLLTPPARKQYQERLLAESTATSVMLMKKEFEAFIFYDPATNLTTKTIFLEKIETNCATCKIIKPDSLMIQLCLNKQCTPEMTNNTIKLTKNVIATVSLYTPEILQKYELKEIEVYDNGNIFAFPVVDYMLGTVNALQVNITSNTSGAHTYEIRAYVYPTPPLGSPSYHSVYFTLSFYSVSPFEDSMTYLWLFILIFGAVAIFACGAGIGSYYLYNNVREKAEAPDTEDMLELQLLEYTENMNQWEKEDEEKRKAEMNGLPSPKSRYVGRKWRDAAFETPANNSGDPTNTSFMGRFADFTRNIGKKVGFGKKTPDHEVQDGSKKEIEMSEVKAPTAGKSKTTFVIYQDDNYRLVEDQPVEQLQSNKKDSNNQEESLIIKSNKKPLVIDLSESEKKRRQENQESRKKNRDAKVKDEIKQLKIENERLKKGLPLKDEEVMKMEEQLQPKPKKGPLVIDLSSTVKTSNQQYKDMMTSSFRKPEVSIKTPIKNASIENEAKIDSSEPKKRKKVMKKVLKKVKKHNPEKELPKEDQSAPPLQNKPTIIISEALPDPDQSSTKIKHPYLHKLNLD
jgi:hypothetical protein